MLQKLPGQRDIDPVIGRDEEIIRVIEILNRRTKNNLRSDWRAWVGKLLWKVGRNFTRWRRSSYP